MVFGALSAPWPLCGVQSQGSFLGISPASESQKVVCLQSSFVRETGSSPAGTAPTPPSRAAGTWQMPSCGQGWLLQARPAPRGPSLLPHRDSWAEHRTHHISRPFPGDSGPAGASPTAASQEGPRPGTHSPRAGGGLDVGDVPTNPPFSGTPLLSPRGLWPFPKPLPNLSGLLGRDLGSPRGKRLPMP